jgi:hypothetical protein
MRRVSEGDRERLVSAEERVGAGDWAERWARKDQKEAGSPAQRYSLSSCRREEGVGAGQDAFRVTSSSAETVTSSSTSHCILLLLTLKRKKRTEGGLLRQI